MANKWVEHIRKWAKDHNLSYGCALSNAECKEAYKSSKEPPKNFIPNRKPLMSKKPEEEVKPKEPERNLKDELIKQLLITPIDIIKNVLKNDGYRTNQNNKIALTSTILNNYKTDIQMDHLKTSLGIAFGKYKKMVY